MKLIHRLCLFLLGIISPIVIAACYAMTAEYNRFGGVVVDSRSKQGIGGITVTCLQGSYENFSTTTSDTGSFEINGYYCDSLNFEDEDGEENGGQYLPRVVPVSEDCENMTVELHQ